MIVTGTNSHNDEVHPMGTMTLIPHERVAVFLGRQSLSDETRVYEYDLLTSPTAWFYHPEGFVIVPPGLIP